MFFVVGWNWFGLRGFRWANVPGVGKIHRAAQIPREPGFDGDDAGIDDLGHIALFVVGKRTQDLVDRLAAVAVATDADTQAREVGAEVADDRLEAVVATGTAVGADAEFAEWQIEVVDHDEHVADVDLVKGRSNPHRGATCVHERLRLDEECVLLADQRLERIVLFLPRGRIPAPREFVKDDEADIVACARVLLARIPQARDKAQTGYVAAAAVSAAAATVGTSAATVGSTAVRGAEIVTIV